MNTIRREQILEYIKAKSAVSLKELSGIFSDVSTMTIHRDLDFLEKSGKIERVRGGARVISEDTREKEPAFTEREVANREKKQIIARKALGLIKSGSSVYIDSGTTTMAIARILEDIPLNVVTNSPNIALALSTKSFVNLTLCGGTLEKKNLSLYGSTAIQTLEKINIDTAFIVASGYSEQSGFTCGNDGETVIKNIVCRKARSVVLLIDSSKFDTMLPFTFAKPDDIDYLVCDALPDEETAAKFKEKGIKVI